MVNRIEFNEVRLAKCQICGGEAVMVRNADGTFFAMCAGECGYHTNQFRGDDGIHRYVYPKTPLEAARVWNRGYYHARGQYEPGGVGSEAWEKKEAAV